ncbi:MAG: hypothetical protein JKY56_10135 [Kofleriaceae bacterium]|nr:hypothetical protein [Kofleriaceae bacterium]
MSTPVSNTSISIRSRNMVGIWVFMLSDAIGFAALLTTVMALRTSSEEFSNAGLLTLSTGVIATVILVAISVCLIAARSLVKARRALILLSALLSALFLGLQYFEYQDIFGASSPGVAIVPGLESFVVVSAYHLVHVAAGMIALLWSLSRKDLPLGPLSVYWHFVDGLWLFIFTLFYLL